MNDTQSSYGSAATKDIDPKLLWLSIFGIFLVYATSLYVLPVYKYSHYGTLPDINSFSESFGSAAKGELFTNHPNYWDQMGRLGQEPEPFKRASLFGNHFMPFLYLLLPVYTLFPSVNTLFFLQALIVACAVFPIFFLLRLKLQSDRLALLCLFVYIVYPLSLGVSTSFYPSYLAITSLSWALYFLLSRKLFLFVLALLVTLSLKEIMAIPVFSCGIYCWCRKYRMLGAVISFGALLYLIAATEYIIPLFSINSEYSFSSYYSDAGGSIYQSLIGIFQQPDLLAIAIFRHEVWVYLANIFIPLLLLPLLSPVTLLVFPLFAQNIFAQNAWYTLYVTGHLTAPVLPFVFYGFICTVSNLLKILRKDLVERGIVVTALVSAFFSYSILMDAKWRDDTLRDAAQSIVPLMEKNDVIAFQGVPDLHAHFSHLYEIVHYYSYKQARWNIIEYDASMCENESVPAQTGNRQKPFDPFSEISKEMCKVKNDNCHRIHYHQLYSRASGRGERKSENIRILVFENRCAAE